ncbi:ribonuclease HIII [Erysipelothrix sp. HDW6C]|uniref:ribonuclease HIII n=1 Tax=Erysipelothrix sp. HDW6C TaxID=2714930 RepID=UPI001408FD0E|nr:ribonuclease HIII [Erysipelothrix sp. HDW6C]QIK69880.1 ribonuclease HIII [Erysipelothrix sp. HDW6C]
MTTITVKLTKNQIAELKKRYQKYPIRYDIQYTEFQIKGTDVSITAYTSGKVVFQGEAAEFHAMNYTDSVSAPSKAVSTPHDIPQGQIAMAGSDEVGTGDYFGPVTVCAAIVSVENYQQIPVKDIVDSKQLTDDKVRTLAPILMDVLDYSLLVLDNRKYNHIHQTMNMNVIKAKLHNQAYLNLAKKYTLPDLCVIDQFMPEASYYKALKNESEVFRQLRFETKAENKFIAVACGAIIARYAFLDYFDKLSEKFNFVFPKGAGPHVDQAGRDFVAQHGAALLDDVAKVHFVNTERILKDE